MAKYKFDGDKLKLGSKIIANVKGDKIRNGNTSSIIANIKGDKIRDKNGSSTMFNLRGNDIRKGNGSSRIATMREVDGAIDGPGGITKAALWLYLVM